MHTTKKKKSHNSVLHRAVIDLDLGLLFEGLRKGVPPNARDCLGRTPLFLLVELSKPRENARVERKALIMLLSKGADVDAKDIDGRFPLQVAALNNHFVLFDFLLKNGANPNLITPLGMPLLSYLIYKSKKERFLRQFYFRVLSSPKIKVNARDNVRRTALHYAYMVGDLHLVDKLLACGADECSKDVYGKKPSYYAADK